MSDTFNAAFYLNTFIFTTFHSDWLLVFLLNSLLYFGTRTLSGSYHPGGPRDEKILDLYLFTINSILFILPGICFMRYTLT